MRTPSLATSGTLPGRYATTNPLASPSTPTAAYTVLRATLTPAQDRDSGPPLPYASGRFSRSAPFRASNASRNPLKSTEYTTPLASVTGGPQCTPSPIGPAQRYDPRAAETDQM